MNNANQYLILASLYRMVYLNMFIGMYFSIIVQISHTFSFEYSGRHFHQ